MLDPQKIAEWKQFLQANPEKIQEEKEVIQKFGSLFNPANLDNLTKEAFKSFLLFRNNKHWDGIHRQSTIITADMEKLKKALKILLDETRDIKERLDILFPPKGENYIKGLGRAIVTPILTVVYPQKYGVFNTKSEQGLEKAGLLPDFKRKSFSEKYIEINRVLNEIAQENGLTLWEMDWVIGSLSTDSIQMDTENSDPASLPKTIGGDTIENYEDFGLEAHLEDFLVENWDRLDIGKKYNLLEEDGDIVGQQYITPIGRFDLLAKSKDDKEWLIIELKKGRTSDAVVGQTLRYIAYAREKLAQAGEIVKGLIIVGEKDDKLVYAIKPVPDISLMTYKVSFKLEE